MTYSSLPNVHLWSPGLFDFKGGIQVFSQFFLEALQALYPPIEQQVFSMHDRPNPQPPLASSSTTFHYCGQLPQRWRTPAFAAQVMAHGLLRQPDLVITTHLNFTVAAAQLKRLTNTPYWTIAHGFEAWDIQRPKVLEALAGADRILAVSSYTRDRLIEHPQINPDRIELFPNTFNIEQFQIAAKPEYLLKRHQLRADQPVILTVNRLEAGEDFHSYDQVLAALPQIRQTLPDVHYVIVGKGGDRPRLEQLIRDRQLEDCVTLAGFIPDDELVNYYNLCDVFAMPSTLEGFGIVYLEALACGKPVIAGLDGGLDALDHGQLGANVDPMDIATLATTVTQILTQQYANPLLFDPAGLRQAVIQRFGTAAFHARLNALFQTAPLASQSAAHKFATSY
ncbi:glycosyltransferase [filamentous cyanobacterium LEGE 11480]|uniref:Glycosyltransferase n=1 Tax=Romeriopsis navalis LEGE 11480 TaxID=2777977 RepID=A0A928Z1Y2_9CYAN|nr:glycosyltransferase [Romeriopsis navalis]MBE9029821.1 glycosyltransferase [Romeriopsis navalis LEGE 11480]